MPSKPSKVTGTAKKAGTVAKPAAKAAREPQAEPAKRVKAAKEQPAKKAARTTARTEPLDKFLQEQKALLEQERRDYLEQADALKAEADQLALDMEPGDTQFDEESGEGGTLNIDRERDLALSAQARAAVEEIDHALAKIAAGTYGTCESCGQPIPKPRLKALPYARLCVTCKQGRLSRR